MPCSRGCCATQAEHYGSVGLIGKNVGKSHTSRTRVEGSTVLHTEHWDGRRDATVRPDVVRYGARVHQQGRKKGETAEVIPMNPKEQRERYG